jgi:hypothetical protein
MTGTHLDGYDLSTIQASVSNHPFDGGRSDAEASAEGSRIGLSDRKGFEDFKGLQV